LGLASCEETHTSTAETARSAVGRNRAIPIVLLAITATIAWGAGVRGKLF
jgi:hypothetical protein